MKIKAINENNIEELKYIMHYCFRIPEDDIEWFAENIHDIEYHKKNCIGAFDKGKLAAALTIHPYQIYFQKSPVKMGGIGAVCTLPEYRNKHYARDLLVKSLEIMNERDQIISMLAPFSYYFYRKYGWGWGIQYKKYNMKIDDIKDYNDEIEGEFRPVENKDLEKVKNIYELFVKKYNGTVRRTDKQWKQSFKSQDRNDKYRYCYINNQGEMEGFIVFGIDAGKIKIDELYYSSVFVKKEILRFLYSHRAQCEKIEWHAPADDNTSFLISEPDLDCSIIKGMMFRVVNVKKVLKEYFKKEKTEKLRSLNLKSFSLKVTDNYASWNNKTFKLDINGRGISVEETDINPDLTISISDFSQLITGFINLTEAREMNKIEGKVEYLDKLENVFTKHPTLINDHF